MAVTLRPTRAAPGELVEAELSGAPFDLTRIQVRYLIVALQHLGSSTALSWISPNVTAVSATTLRFEVPGAASQPNPPLPPGPCRVVFRFGMWEDRATSGLDVVTVPGVTAPRPAAAAPTPAMPVSSGVHSMQLAPDRAGPGQRVTAMLLDGSLDLSRVSPAAFSVWLTIVSTGAALNHRVQYRILDRATVEFTVPPIGPGGFRAGGYRVVMRYGFWEGRGARDLIVTTTAVASGASPYGWRGLARLFRPAFAVRLPPHVFGIGWPAPLASAMPGRVANPVVSLMPARGPHPLGSPAAPTPTPVRLVPVVPMPSAAMPIFLAAGPGPARAPTPAPAPVATPVPALLPAGTSLSNLAAVCRSRASDRISAFFALDAKASTGQESVRPIIDGIEIAPALAELISNAERYIYLSIWALDAHMRLSAAGQRWNGPGQPTDTVAYLLRKRGAELLHQQPKLEVKVLVWASILDDEYAPGQTDLDALTSVLVPWNQLSAFNPNSEFPRVLDVLRGAPYFCTADEALLARLHREYWERPAIAPDTLLRFPSGIAVATQAHPSLTGSHHQKMLLTEKGSYIGGLNLVKEYWDSREHLLQDDGRRATSGGPASGGAGGSWSSVGSSGVLHDSGSIVRGASMEQALEIFAMRWDEAVTDGDCHEGLVEALRDELLPSIADALTTPAERAAQMIRERRVVQGSGRFRGAADAGYVVEDAMVLSTLPRQSAFGPVEHIKTAYLRAVQSMNSVDSFAYFETQYFSDHSLAKQLFHQWRTHVRRREGPLPFAYVVLPYNPSTAWVDEFREDFFAPGGLWDIGERLGALRGEFRNLRWLEISTARRIYTQPSSDQPWQPILLVDDPLTQITWASRALRDAPDSLAAGDAFTVTDARKLRSDGSVLTDRGQPVLETRTFDADEVMTDSDIMAFCLVADGNARSGRGRDYVRDYLLHQEVYVHSKAALFLNAEPEPSYATIGSANLNPRSLADGGSQDSELNVWFAGRARVEALWRSLASEHLAGIAAADVRPQNFLEQGWDNLRRLFRGQPVNGNVVRLDVADRYDHQEART
jgi:phosphatidylserine/phosphatidylglycerophosphate/cardiolipin synthase-like enzyme